MSTSGEITRLLGAMRQGESGVLDQLLPLVYDELRGIAHGSLMGGHGGATLNTTAVVHEAYLKLAKSGALTPRDRGHFFAIAALAMRQILVDRARSRLTLRRGDGANHLPLGDHDIAVDARAAELLELDSALARLEKIDAVGAKVVELRFFGGFSVEESAEVLQISPRTVKRKWREARALLYRELHE